MMKRRDEWSGGDRPCRASFAELSADLLGTTDATGVTDSSPPPCSLAVLLALTIGLHVET